MDELLMMLEARLANLNCALRLAKKDQDFPEGSLRVSTSNKRVRYYWMNQKASDLGEYIKKDNHQFARELAQKSYNRKFIKMAESEILYLQSVITHLSKNNADMSYDKLSLTRKNLVNPYILPDNIYAKNWQEESYKTSNYLPECKVYSTKRGEMVRSKSEAIIADILYELKIPYKYEKALVLKNGTIKFPDFTVLNKKTRQEVYIEHFGLLDDELYLNSNLLKLDEYRNNGIYLGKNLLFTYETENSPLDIKGIRKMFRELL